MAINGQQFIMAGSLGVRFYRQPRTLELVRVRVRIRVRVSVWVSSP